jgi:hypothetical protein|tara:strand:- start:739 stop:852 length:114 start_codon:yes stop_codon:yes gene_type:complete
MNREVLYIELNQILECIENGEVSLAKEQLIKKIQEIR